MSFNEANTVEQIILDAVARPSAAPTIFREKPFGYGDSFGGETRPGRWEYMPATQLPRQSRDVMVEPWVREALIRLNPEIAVRPNRADEVIYNLRAILLAVQADGLIRQGVDWPTA